MTKSVIRNFTAAGKRWAFSGVLATVCCLLMTAGWTALAQERTGNLTGVASDASGAVVPGVQVTITNKASQRVLSARTGGDGTYYAGELEPGRYTVRFEKPGFSRYEVPDVIMLVGKTLRLNASMQVGTVEQTVQVTESAPLIDISGTTVAQNLTAEEIDRMPKGRSFQSLAITSAFVNEGEIEGGIQVNGASGAENNFMIDGLSNTSLINGKSRQNAQFEYLQEVHVKTNGIEAEYGGALGGVINGITKSGGNQFHGEGHYYFYGSPFNAAPVKRLVLSPADDTTVFYAQDAKQKDHSHEIGGSLGGYLVKNKLYFFTSAQPRWRRETRDYKFSLGKENGSIDRKQLYMSLFNKLSWDPTNRIRTNWSWLYSPTYSTGSLLAYNGGPNELSSSLAANEPQKTRGWYGPQSGYSGNIDITTSATSLLSVRGGYFYDNYKDTGVPSISNVTIRSSGSALTGLPADIRNLPIDSFNTPRVQQSFHDLVTRAYIKADFSKYGNFVGTHNLKVGVGTQKTVNNVDLGYPGGGYVYVWFDRAFRSNATGQTQRGTYGYYEVNDIGTRGATGANITHLYIQDQWRIVPRLTLNLGLRTEKERIPSFSRAVKDYAFDFGFGQKMAPRLGATLDVYGDGRLKLYGSWGRFYDWTKYELARGTFGGDFWTVRYRALDIADVFSLSGTNMPGKNLWTDDPNSFRNRRVPGFEDVDPDIKPMSQDMLNLGAEYQLGPQTVIEVRYVHNNLRRTIEDIGSLVNGDEVYIYGNPGEGLGKQYFTTGLGPAGDNPKAKRVYDAVEIGVRRRFANRWFGSASYVWSRLYGNYAGLANSDEISSPTTGRTSSTAQQQGGSIARPGSNVTRGWDLDELLFDSRGDKGVYGRLATDRPHVFKLYGGYEFKFGTDLGGFFYGGSGTPVSTVFQTINQIPVFAYGRGDLGRTPFYSQTDLVIGHNVNLGEHKKLRFEFNMQNLFNQKTARSIYSSYNRERRQSSAIALDHVDLTKGYDPLALLGQASEGAAGSKAPQFGMEDIFNPGFAGRFLVKFIF